MALDPLADRLESLLADGSIVRSALTGAMRRRLVVLFEIGALSEERAGGGRRVALRDEPAVRTWIASEYPSGLTGVGDGLPPRAESVANFRDSKRGKRLAQRPVLLRGFGDAVLRRGREVIPIGDLTRRYRVAAALVDRADPWHVDGTLALVENFELFLHVEIVVPGLTAALWYGGRIDQGLLDWIGGMPAVRVVHVADFDPTGLDEYLRAQTTLGDRVSLFVPKGLPDLVSRYGQAGLLLRSRAVLERLRQVEDPALQSVLEILSRYGKGLEQEALLLAPGRS